MGVARIPSIEGGIQPTIFDAKADLLTATAADTPARLAVGANNTVLTADSSTATGLKWAAAAGGGKVLQVVEGSTSTQVSSSSSTYADTGLSATITPSSASSQILVFVSQNGNYQANSGGGSNSMGLKLFRDATEIAKQTSLYSTFSSLQGNTNGLSILDSPATTSATTYKTQFNSVEAKATVYVQIDNVNRSSIILMEIGA
jgi:hypothetical protein